MIYSYNKTNEMN